MADLACIDWTDAFANSAHIPDGEAFYARWTAEAAAFRATARGEADIAYGAAPRQRLDLFLPSGTPRGLAVFVHGGYWMESGKGDWSHLAAGAVARGWAVALPGYVQAPEARIAGISRALARAVAVAAGRVAGPVRLTGHSAGGHLVTRMVCDDSPLDASVAARVDRVISISGVHDLRPLQLTDMNATLRLDPDEAAAESPALRSRRAGVGVTAWVGAAERPEFLRQAGLLSEAWRRPGAPVPLIAEPERHHFDVIEGLTDPDHPLIEALLGD